MSAFISVARLDVGADEGIEGAVRTLGGEDTGGL